MRKQIFTISKFSTSRLEETQNKTNQSTLPSSFDASKLLEELLQHQGGYVGIYT